MQQYDSAPNGGTLVIQPLPGIENMVAHLRILKAIARASPDQSITLLAHPQGQAEHLIGHEPWIKNILAIDERHKLSPFSGIVLGKKLKPHKFDSVWILHHSPKYYIACSFAGIQIRYGFGFGWLKDLLTTPLFLSTKDKKLHPYKKSEKLLNFHSIALEHTDHFLTLRKQQAISDHKNEHNWKKPWVAFGFGASHDLRIWPGEKYAELAVETLKSSDSTVILCGLPAEKKQAKEIHQAVQKKGKSVELAINSALNETIDLLANCQYFIGNDNGLLSIASALGTPSIGIFSALGPQLYTLGLFDTILAFQKQRAISGIENIEMKDVLNAFLKLKEK